VTRKVTITIGDRGPALTEDEDERVDALVTLIADALKTLTVNEMAEVVARSVTEYMTWAILSGQSEQEAIEDVLTRSEAYTCAMNATTLVLYSSLLQRPGAAESLVERERAKLRLPGATPWDLQHGQKRSAHGSDPEWTPNGLITPPAAWKLSNDCN
jgi:hypothetical protein